MTEEIVGRLDGPAEGGPSEKRDLAEDPVATACTGGET